MIYVGFCLGILVQGSFGKGTTEGEKKVDGRIINVHSSFTSPILNESDALIAFLQNYVLKNSNSRLVQTY